MLQVAAAILRENGRYLIGRRRDTRLWEFPGGKLEAGETAEECLAREIREELGVTCSVGGLYGRGEERDHTPPVELFFFRARILSGSPRPLAHEELRYVHPRELRFYAFCPQDQAIAQSLQEDSPRLSRFFWDFDGTLFDTYPTIADTMTRALGELGVSCSRETVYRRLKVSIGRCIREYSRESGVAADKIDELYHRYIRDTARNPIRLYPGAEETLRELKSLGGRHYVYTHRGDTTYTYLERFGLTELFDDVLTADTGFQAKPAPDALNHLMKKHKLSPLECVMIGDRPIDVQAGWNAGMAGCLFDPEGFYRDFDAPLRAESMEGLLRALA